MRREKSACCRPKHSSKQVPMKLTTESSDSLLLIISNVKCRSHGVKVLTYLSHLLTHSLCLLSFTFAFIVSSFSDMEEEEQTICFADPTHFITDADFCYQEFARREEDHFQVFRVQVRMRLL